MNLWVVVFLSIFSTSANATPQPSGTYGFQLEGTSIVLQAHCNSFGGPGRCDQLAVDWIDEAAHSPQSRFFREMSFYPGQRSGSERSMEEMFERLSA